MSMPTIRPKDIVGPISTVEFAHDWIVTKYGYVPNPSPLLNPRMCEQMLRDFHRARGIKYSWGDYGAWREIPWNGFYGHEEQKYYHLGVDMNVTPGTPICVDYDCEVAVVDTDHNDAHPEPQGWGRRVIVAVPKFRSFFIYAHLSPKVRCRVGEKLRAGTAIGHVGIPRNNGGWYSHWHFQVLIDEAWRYFHNRLHELDGYCSPQDWPRMSRWCPNPAPYLQIP